MQLPSIDRIQSIRPFAVESASLSTGRVVPVAPVNPSVENLSVAEPSVVNAIGDKPNAGEKFYTSVSDPVQPGSDAAGVSKDWTIHHPVPEKVEYPPPEPLYKILMNNFKAIWVASSAAVQVQPQQVNNPLDMAQPNIYAVPGDISTEMLTYSPTKINKTEKTLT